MDGNDDTGIPNITYGNVALAFACFILFDTSISTFWGLGVGSAIITAAVRCVMQLSLVALLWKQVFEANNPWLVAAIACLLNIMGTMETVINKSKRRYSHMFPAVFASMMGSTIPVSILGTRFAMKIDPFWRPDQYIPIVGMLCGAAISGVVISVSYVLKEIYENKDQVEALLALGATRFEACKPIAKEALKFALTPNINQMSVIGIIAIPGTMAGAILGGAAVEQAARLPMVVMFMISSATTLSSIATTVLTLGVVVDMEHRVRTDKIDSSKPSMWRARDWVVERAVEGIAGFWLTVRGTWKKQRSEDGVAVLGVSEERRALLE